MTDIMLNLSAWIERRRSAVGPYADHIIHSVKHYEEEIERLRRICNALHAAQTYSYIGRDGKSTLARDLEDKRDALQERVEVLEMEIANATKG
jgi:hypothetical protein